ncbi:hypothetical protein [Streptomyces lateritius]|uniref:hypothetical protein n=1 Tax=Streptomyces lateritius TaxID=67313 RepID=UPI001C8BB281|nr:hypothetical protein [Streptomyces lateritius]MBX9425492.1 hypothetical protein [Streptomyces lateritius]
MSSNVTSHPNILRALHSAVAVGDLPQAVLLIDDELPATAAAARTLAASAQLEINDLKRTLAGRPVDLYTQWPTRSKLRRLETIRDRAAFVAAVLDETVTEVAA